MKIAVTGMGVISCCGNTVNSFWDSIVYGRTGLGTLTRFAESTIKTSVVGEVKHFELDGKFGPRIQSRTDSHIQYALAATDQAVSQSKLDFSTEDLHRVHCVIGTCSGSYNYIENAIKNSPVHPTFLTGSLNNMISAYINMYYGILGAGLVINGACASGAQAIALGAMLIETDQADVVIVGGTEDWIHPAPISGLESLRALTYDTAGCRPFDRYRSGFSISEGSAVLILEREDHAYRRNADILAWLSGYGISSDANHPTAPREDGVATKHMITQSLNKSGLTSNDISYVNAHATGTLIGDRVEAIVLESIFGTNPYISSTKAITGHSIGAVGAMEAIVAVKTLQEQIIPATTNLVDTDCPGKHIIDKAISETVNHVLSNNFGFGGTNSALVFSRY